MNTSNTDIKPGMIVYHKYIDIPLVVVKDELGPAYSGNEFKNDEISLSHAIQEYKNGNLILHNRAETDREKALAWWEGLPIDIRAHFGAKYYPTKRLTDISGIHMEHIWHEEMTEKVKRKSLPNSHPAPSPSSDEGLKCTPQLSINPVESLHTDIGFMYPLFKEGKEVKGGFNFQRLFRMDTYGYTAELKAEKKANASRLVNAWNCHDDLYKALADVSPLLDGLINRTPTGKKRDELCDLNIKVKSALLKAKS